MRVSFLFPKSKPPNQLKTKKEKKKVKIEIDSRLGERGTLGPWVAKIGFWVRSTATCKIGGWPRSAAWRESTSEVEGESERGETEGECLKRGRQE